MAKSFQLRATRVHDLTMVVNSLTPQEITKNTGAETIKNIRGVHKLADELEEADKAYIEVTAKLDKVVEKVRDEFQEELKKVQGDKEAEEKLLKDANIEVKKVLKKESKKEKFEEVKEKLTNVLIGSDDRYKLLKELIEKVGPEKYISTEALVETLDGIDSAKEA